MRNVLLIGIGGVYNYGCEAIVRGTYNILKKIDPKVNITYASYNYEYDINRLKDLNIRILNRHHIKKWSIKNIVRKIGSIIGIKYIIHFDKCADFKSFDYVFSIGGDMYTLTHDHKYDGCLPIFMERLQKQGSKYILWGCSVGPFEKNKSALTFFRNHLEKIDAIVAREYETIDYLKKLSITKNVHFAPDPAFMVNGPTKKNKLDTSRPFTLGINLSPLSALYEYGNIDNAIDVQSKIIEFLIDKYNANIILLPHVLSENPMDDDLQYLIKLKENISQNFLHKITIIDNDPGFVGLKNEIIKCDVVLAARMHCAINAISCNVPTLFISYSKKAIGMSELVYGSEDFVISLKDFSNIATLRAKIDKLIDQKIDVEKIKMFNYQNIL